MNSINNNHRIFKNTIFLYVRTILMMGVSLYTSKIVLNTLGIEDFGIYNVVGGVVTMLSFLGGAMASATQRFLSFEIGKNNTHQLNNIFKMSINIHILILIVIVIIAEIIGLWFVNKKLVISVDRLAAANWVFQFSLFSFCCTIVSVPYNALIIAHEKMSTFTYISAIDILLKLGSVLLLQTLADEKLKAYATLLALVSLTTLGCYYAYSRATFKNIRFQPYWDTHLFKILISYVGWNLFGNLAAATTNQGTNILLNIFFGTPINAARAIAFQVNSTLTSFTSSLQMAINPQIVKSHANGNKEYMLKLVFSGARYSFYLLYLISIPLLLQTETILEYWLGKVPEYTSIFCKLVIFDALIISLSGTIMTAFQATGIIKTYQLVIGLIIILNLPISYLFLTFGYPPQITMLVSIVISIFAFFTRMLLLSRIFTDIGSKLAELLFRTTAVTTISVAAYLISPKISGHTTIILLYHSLTSWAIILTCIWCIGINKKEQKYIKNKIIAIKHKFQPRNSR